MIAVRVRCARVMKCCALSRRDVCANSIKPSFMEWPVKPIQNLIIYTWLVIGILFFIGTFYVAWNTTKDYRDNLDNLKQNSYSPSVKSSII